jgi:hypothetical protein
MHSGVLLLEVHSLSGQQKHPECAQGACSSDGPGHAKQEQKLHEELKQVWAASAVVEKLELEIDHAESILAEAVGEALKAGTATKTVREAANLTLTEFHDLTGAPNP